MKIPTSSTYSKTKGRCLGLQVYEYQLTTNRTAGRFGKATHQPRLVLPFCAVLAKTFQPFYRFLAAPCSLIIFRLFRNRQSQRGDNGVSCKLGKDGIGEFGQYSRHDEAGPPHKGHVLGHAVPRHQTRLRHEAVRCSEQGVRVDCRLWLRVQRARQQSYSVEPVAESLNRVVARAVLREVRGTESQQSVS